MNRTVWRLLAASLASLAFPQAAGAEASRGTCQCDGILDWNDPSFGKCDWWGDVHITKSWRSPEVFDFQGYGVYSYASTTKCGGDFEMQLFQCPYSRNGNAVAIGVAVKVNNGDVVVVANDTVFNPNDADVSADTMEDLKKGVSIVSNDKCVRLNVNTKLYRRAPTLLHNGNLRVIQEALTNEGICGAPTFGGEFVAPDGPDMLFPEEMFKEMCGFCEDQTGVSVPGCTPAGGGDPVISPGCDFLQLRPSKEFVDCAGDQDPVLEEAKADGENCVAYVRLQKQTSCSEFCTEKGSTCEMAIDQPNGQKCVASVSSLSEIDTSKINCDAKGFRDLICVCKKPDNPAPGPTPEEACAEQTDFSVQDAANLCREKADFLKGVVYPGTGASPDAILKEAFLRACILDVCSAAPEDREEIAENAADQDPSDPPVEPSTTTTTTTTAPAVVGDESYVFGFTPYVGSSSPFQPQGVVEVESLPDGTTRLSWSLTGLDPACSSQCNQANCCGVHIHEGKSCKIPAGAHFWDSGSISPDPWLSVKYDSSTDPANLLSKEVKTGLSNEDVLGRTLVIHDATGARIACGIIEPSTTTVFEKYPNYGGGLPLTAGGVKVESDDTTQKLSWLFTHGLDPQCTESECTAANCCGVHIHEGMTCSDADAIGGHYWNKDAHSEDPWKNVRYVIQGSMPSAVNDIMVTTGYAAEDINGRAVVVHDYDGARIGCAIIELPVEGDDLYVFDFSPYPGSSSPYQPQGVVEVKSTEDDNTVLSWSLTGLDPGCSSPCSQTNCCGIHIHEGTSCAEDAGPHHWNGHDEDPWLSVKYDSSGDPANVLSMEVHTHLTRSDVLGRTLVIHDKTGARIACGIIEESTTTVFEEYPGYDGDLPLTSGGVKVESDDTTQKLSWLFTHGLDPRCDESECTAANCCGVHIHEGMTCSDADAIGGHYWNKDAHSEDPWKNVRYVIQGSMPSAVNDIMVTTGSAAEDINGRAVVVHDYDGARIGCAIIELPVVETPVEGDDLYVFDFSPYPGSSSPYQPQGVVEVKSTEDDNTVLSWSLTGLDPGCSSPCSQTNCCGIHIHEGTSCAEDAGPHHWNGHGEDPWLSVKYDSSEDPANVLSMEVHTHLTRSDVLGRTLVIHDKTGARIACGIIEESTTTVFEEYPGYDGDLPLTSGGVKVESDDTTQKLSWLFTHGLDPRCDESECTAANCCGVHIHEGMTCSDADAIGGHYWNKDAHSEDPWKNVRYVIQGSMPSAVNDVMVTTGYAAEDINGRAVVVHDYDGARIGCATIKICVDSKSTVKGAIEKLEEAVDQIKDALSDLSAMVNSSGKGGHSGYHSSHYYGTYGTGKEPPYKCNNICADICQTQHPEPAHCQHQCKTRQNAILDIAQVYCNHGLCSKSNLIETGEEVGLLQRRTQRSEEELEAELELGFQCRQTYKYCQLFCKRGFLLPVQDSFDEIKKCRAECEANFEAFQAPLEKYVGAGCCASN